MSGSDPEHQDIRPGATTGRKYCRWDFICFLSYLLMIMHCSTAVRERRLATEASWEDHPQVVLAFSKAIVDGIRILMDELLISESWFGNMDISVFSDKKELVRGKILDLSLQQQVQPGLVTSWRVFQSKTAAISYITTTSFGDTLSGKPDSLHLDIYGQNARESVRNAFLPRTIDLVYWRNAEDQDKVASLRMEITQDSLYKRR